MKLKSVKPKQRNHDAYLSMRPAWRPSPPRSPAPGIRAMMILFFRDSGAGGLRCPRLSIRLRGGAKKSAHGGNFVSHTLRKTFGYHQRVTFGVGLPELMVAFNHSNQRQTLDYLCIQPDKVKNIYSNIEILALRARSECRGFAICTAQCYSMIKLSPQPMIKE